MWITSTQSCTLFNCSYGIKKFWAPFCYFFFHLTKWSFHGTLTLRWVTSLCLYICIQPTLIFTFVFTCVFSYDRESQFGHSIAAGQVEKECGCRWWWQRPAAARWQRRLLLIAARTIDSSKLWHVKLTPALATRPILRMSGISKQSNI